MFRSAHMNQGPYSRMPSVSKTGFVHICPVGASKCGLSCAKVGLISKANRTDSAFTAM